MRALRRIQADTQPASCRVGGEHRPWSACAGNGRRPAPPSSASGRESRAAGSARGASRAKPAASIQKGAPSASNTAIFRPASPRPSASPIARPETIPLDRAGKAPASIRRPRVIAVSPTGTVAAPRSMTPCPNTDESSHRLRSPSRSRCAEQEPPEQRLVRHLAPEPVLQHGQAPGHIGRGEGGFERFGVAARRLARIRVRAGRGHRYLVARRDAPDSGAR